jgi:LPXTG-site transpeptidase (sortase) family protein
MSDFLLKKTRNRQRLIFKTIFVFLILAVFSLSFVSAQTATAAAKTVKKPVNRLIIKKIKVDAPIVESKNGKWALMRGMWRLPQTSTPDKGSNTVISGHRWLHKFPHPVTFWALNKVQAGDEIIVIWNGKTIKYKVFETKIVNQYATSILKPTKEPILTLFTCDPIYVGTNRLVVLARPVVEKNTATSTPKST